MKCTIPEISWHNRDPVLSVDIQSCKDAPHPPSRVTDTYRLATGGTDTHVVIWLLCILDNGAVSVEMLSDLTRHNRPVNAVRFSPDGVTLASADDEAAIILWRRNEETSKDLFIEESENENREHWTILKMLRGHIEDIHDLSWSRCSQFLISGSVDNSAILWDVVKGKHFGILKDHKGFVQGVAWDPKGQYVCTLCSDRCLRVYNVNTKKVISKVSKGPQEENHKPSHLFYDDTLKSFCRRLTFSPDGELLLAPSGIVEMGQGKNINVIHIFCRNMFNRPVICLPTQDRYTVAVRFCPLLFDLKAHLKDEERKEVDDDESRTYTDMFALPYRMVFAVATQNAVLVYDTQQPIPFAKISNIHYTQLSDLSWSSDGKLLVISSTDGYCSLVSFEDGELGSLYSPPASFEQISGQQWPKNTSKSPTSNSGGKSSGDASLKNSRIKSSPKITLLENQNALKSVVDQYINVGDSTNTPSSKPEIRISDQHINVGDSTNTPSKPESRISDQHINVGDSTNAPSKPESRISDQHINVGDSTNTPSKPESRISDQHINVGDSTNTPSKPESRTSNQHINVHDSTDTPASVPESGSKNQTPVVHIKHNNDKPGKRVTLITLSTAVKAKEKSSEETAANTDCVTGVMESNQDLMAESGGDDGMEEDPNSKPLSEKCELSKSPRNIQTGPRTPRRVSFITLSSPKSSPSYKDKL